MNSLAKQSTFFDNSRPTSSHFPLSPYWLICPAEFASLFCTCSPQIRRRLRLAVFLGLLRAYLFWWKQVLFDPQSWFEKMVKRGSLSIAWFMLAAVRRKALAKPQPVAQAPAAGVRSSLELVIGTLTFLCTVARNTNHYSSRNY